jgi:hypothetical protein
MRRLDLVSQSDFDRRIHTLVGHILANLPHENSPSSRIRATAQNIRERSVATQPTRGDLGEHRPGDIIVISPRTRYAFRQRPPLLLEAMTDEAQEVIDYGKLSFLEFVRRAPVGTVLAVTICLIGAGFAVGKFAESKADKSEVEALRAGLAARAPANSSATSASATKEHDPSQPSAPQISNQSATKPTVSPCEILEAGTAFMQANKYDEAIAEYSAIEHVDKIGRQTCTESTYALLGVSYTARAKQVANTNLAKALDLTRKANFYHRAAICALWCSRLNDCKYSEDFWGDNRFYQ